MHGAARGRDALLQPAPVREQAHAVAGGERHLRERQRRRDGRVEHRLRADARTKEAAGIDEQPHGLAALGLIDLRDQLSAPRRRAPAHVAPLVAGTVVAQAVELPAGPKPLRAPLLDRHLSAANQVQRLLPPLLKIRIDPDGLLDGRNAPPLDEAPRVAPLQSHSSHQRVTALARRHAVLDPRRRAGRHGHRHLGQVLTEGRIDVVRQADVDGRRRCGCGRRRVRLSTFRGSTARSSCGRRAGAPATAAGGDRAGTTATTTASHSTRMASARRSIHAGPIQRSPAASNQNARDVRPNAARRPARAAATADEGARRAGDHFGTSTAARMSAVI